MEPQYIKKDRYVTAYYKDKAMTLLHREDGPAEEFHDGTKRWWLHGQRHREDGPACEYQDGTKVWCIHGLRHRTDGPAYEDPRYNVYEYWLNGTLVTEEEFRNRTLKETINIEGKEFTLHKLRTALNIYENLKAFDNKEPKAPLPKFAHYIV
jgi:hypothetical protein